MKLVSLTLVLSVAAALVTLLDWWRRAVFIAAALVAFCVLAAGVDLLVRVLGAASGRLMNTRLGKGAASLIIWVVGTVLLLLSAAMAVCSGGLAVLLTFMAPLGWKDWSVLIACVPLALVALFFSVLAKVIARELGRLSRPIEAARG